jgi:hypothetical protein
MSINNLCRAKLSKAVSGNEYHKMLIKMLYEPYWDECIVFYPRRNRGTHHCRPKLMSYQVRMYKTWKHNRKTQWKN